MGIFPALPAHATRLAEAPRQVVHSRIEGDPAESRGATAQASPLKIKSLFAHEKSFCARICLLIISN